MDNDDKNRYVYFQDTTVLNLLTETLDYYEWTNLSSVMTNLAKN